MVKDMEEEIKMIKKNEVWELVDLPKRKMSLELSGYTRSSLTLNDQFKNTRFRQQLKDVEKNLELTTYNENFVPIAHLDTIRALLAFVVKMK